MFAALPLAGAFPFAVDEDIVAEGEGVRRGRRDWLVASPTRRRCHVRVTDASIRVTPRSWQACPEPSLISLELCLCFMRFSVVRAVSLRESP